MLNQGDDIAGIVHSVGSNVYEFKPGDRVAAFHQMMAPGGSYAEYALSWSHTTFHIPPKTSFEEAATIPLAGMTAAIGLYQRLSLPLPWHPTSEQIPLIIYGAATAVGSYAIQLAQLSNIHPLICVAGRGVAHVEGLIDKSKGDVIIDYRNGDEALVKELEKAVKRTSPGKVQYAFDAVSEKGSSRNICKVLDPSSGAITVVLHYEDIPEGFAKSHTIVGSVFKETVFEDTDGNSWEKKTGSRTGDQEFGFVFYRFMARGLQEGWFKSHPYEVVPGGLGGVEQGLKDLKEGKASAVKYVFRIAETEGLGSE